MADTGTVDFLEEINAEELVCPAEIGNHVSAWEADYNFDFIFCRGFRVES